MSLLHLETVLFLCLLYPYGVTMIISKAFALSLLFLSSVCFAQVRLNTNIEVNEASPKRTLNVGGQEELSVDEYAIIYNKKGVLIEITLVAEQETDVSIRYAIYARNNEGIYEFIGAPLFSTPYGETETISLGHTNGDTFILTLKATQV